MRMKDLVTQTKMHTPKTISTTDTNMQFEFNQCESINDKQNHIHSNLRTPNLNEFDEFHFNNIAAEFEAYL